MGREDVRQALVAMEQDDEVRARLAAGDFDVVEDLELSADEQLLVQDAASDMPEVAGFSFGDYFLKIDGVDGESSDDKHKGEIQLDSFKLSAPKWHSAIQYGLKI